MSGEKYTFVSIVCHHTKSKSGACCVMATEEECRSRDLMNAKLQGLGLLPDECHSIKVYGGGEEIEEGFELNRFYNAAELKEMGY